VKRSIDRPVGQYLIDTSCPGGDLALLFWVVTSITQSSSRSAAGMSTRILRPLAAAVLLFLAAAPLGAQELSLLFVRASSPNPELPAPTGFELAGRVGSRGWVIGLGFARYSQATTKTGVVCRVYSPRIDCDSEQVETNTALGGLRIEAMRSVPVGGVARLGVGGGASFNSVRASSDGVSGRRADLQLPNDGQLGYLGRLSVDVSPVPSLPLRVEASYAVHWVRFRGCADPTDPTSGYAPFCGNDRFQELAVGLSWDLSGLRGR